MLRDGFLRFCNDPEIACCKAERELEQLRTENASLREQLAESQRREQAAVEDLKKHRKYKCDCCYYADKQGRYIPCRDCQLPISNYGDGWQWRGPRIGQTGAEGPAETD